MKLEFAEIDDDPNIKEVVEELKRKGQEANRVNQKRTYSEMAGEGSKLSSYYPSY